MCLRPAHTFTVLLSQVLSVRELDRACSLGHITGLTRAWSYSYGEEKGSAQQSWHVWGWFRLSESPPPRDPLIHHLDSVPSLFNPPTPALV